MAVGRVARIVLTEVSTVAFLAKGIAGAGAVA